MKPIFTRKNMSVFKKIKKLFNLKSYTQEEEEIRDKICEYFIKQLDLENINKFELNTGKKFEIELFQYLSVSFKAINVLNAVYATLMMALAYEFSHALSDVYKEIKMKDFFKFHLSVQSEDLFSTICVAFEAAKLQNRCSCHECRSLFFGPPQLRGIYNDFLKKKIY